MAFKPTHGTVTYAVDSRVATVSLNRPQQANAQDLRMTYDIDECFGEACADPEVRCIILRANGRHFSAGHDLRGDGLKMGKDAAPVTPHGRKAFGGARARGIEHMYTREREIYKDMCERWRNLPKPTVAAVQGKCIAGGLMLCWVCDIILAADDAEFRDLTVGMGVCGAEFFAHPYELGPRKAKEWLFTSDALTAAEAEKWGMVNRVVPRSELDAAAVTLARRIAEKPIFALQATKEAVNQAQDAGGRAVAMNAAFSLHHLCHANNLLVHKMPIDPTGSKVVSVGPKKAKL